MMCHKKLCNLYISVILLCVFVKVRSYNVDTVNYVKHKGQPSSMFGFAVSSHIERGQSWVLVGAPEAQTSLSRVEKGGSVFKCAITDDDYCQEVPFDRREDNTDSQGVKIDSKSHQWFGATLSAPFGEDTPIVACAPRYVWFANKRDRKDPVGTCYVARDGSYSEYSPCRTNLFGYHRQGSCQAGFSAAISKDGKNLFVGAPGSWYWQGQLYSIDAHATFPYSPGKFGGGPFGTGQVIQQSLETRPSVFATAEGPAVDDDSYMGYSLAVGLFFGKTQQEAVAVGMPRSTNLEGKVLLWTWNLTLHSNFTGHQLGSYFGYAIAAVDVNGDGRDEIIVGAPMHTVANNEGKYEVGRVHVLFTGGVASGRDRIILDGYNSKSRFGLAVASVGDINLDGYGDFAVGAPYDGPNERGAVYIFHGFEDGVREKYAQVIYAEDMTQQGGLISTFGFSIAGNGMDLDGNRYPDMIVGAYLADTAFFFRSRPVVKMDVTVNFMTSNRHIILDEKNCTLINREKVPCTTLDICFKYTGVGVPSTIDLEIQTLLDARKKKDPRMFFLQQEGRNSFNETVKLEKDMKICGRPRMVYIKNDVRDKLTQLEAEVRYSMRGEQVVHEGYQRNPRAGLFPVLDLSSPPVKKDVISIKKNCGSDNICIPNLKLHAQPNVERYLLGSNEKLEIDVVVQNEGEDSFESTFNLQIPPGMDFIRISENNNTEVRVLCSSAPNSTIQCDIGNPLPARKIAKFRVQLNPYHKEGMNPSYDFIMSVNSTNPENPNTIDDNTKTMSINIWVDSKLELQGTSKPAEIHYNTTQYVAEKIVKESDIGPQVIHVYSIRNNGPSGINEAEMSFIWPFQTESGEDLFYLLEQPAIIGNARCEPVDANYRNYELEFRKKSLWESIGIDVSKGDFTIASSQTAGEFSGGQHVSGSSSTSSSSSSSSSSSTSGGRSNIKFDTGDGSFVHEQRGKQHGTQSGSRTGYGSQGGSSNEREGSNSYASSSSSYGGGGGGQQYSSHGQTQGTYGQAGRTTWTQDSGWNKTTTHTGPITTHTYTKNYTVYGDSSNVDKNIIDGQQQQNSSSSGGSFSHKPNIIYTTSGSQQGQEASRVASGQSESQSEFSLGPQIGGGSSTSGQSSSGGYQWNRTEESMSGQNLRGVQGGTLTYVARDRDGVGKDQTFDWDSRNKQKGGSSYEQRGGASYDDRYNQQQGSSGGSRTNYHATSGQSGQSGQVDQRYYQQGSGGQHQQVDQRHNQQAAGQGQQVDQRYHQQATGQGQPVDQRYHQQTHDRGEDRRTETNAERGNSNYGDLYENAYSSEEYTVGENVLTEGRAGSTHSTGGGAAATASGGSGGQQQHGQHASDERRRQEEERRRLEEERRQRQEEEGRRRQEEEERRRQEEESGYRHQEHHRTAGRNRSTYGQYDQRDYEQNVASHGLGAAALGGHGFQTTSLDLGVLGGNRNADETVSSATRGQHEYSAPGASNQGQTQGQAQEGQGQYSSQSSSSSWSRQYGQVSAEQRAAWEAEQRAREHHAQSGGQSQSWSSQSESHWSSRSSTASPPSEYVGRDNVATDKPDMRQFVGRRKRQAGDIYDNEDITNLMHCKSTKCLQVKCTVGPLSNGEDAIIALRSRLNIRTLKGISTSQPVSLSTMMLARISKLPYIGRPLDPPTYSHEIFTTVQAPEPDIKPDIVPLWVVVLSAVAGTLILLLLIFLLYKCGFFKRHRPNETAERQPLNRNGHYQNGDEAL